MKTTFFSTMLLVILTAALYGQSGSINNTLGSGGTFRVKVTGNDSLLIVKDNGNVGIGTTAPSSRLDVVGNISVPPGNAFSYSAPKSKVAVIGNAAFVVAGPNTMTATRNVTTVADIPTSLYTTDGPSSGTVGSFTAPINLPDGAVVTSMTAYVFDSNATYDLTVLIVRQPLGALSASTLASVSSSGSAGSGSFTTTSISDNTIDNASYSYQAVFQSRANGNHAILHVKLEYTVTKVD